MRLASAFDRSPSLVALTRLEDDTLVDVNDRFIAVLGYARTQLIGRTLVDAGVWERERHAVLLDQARHFRSVPGEPVELRTASGSTYRGLLNAEVVTLDGVDHLLNIIQDIRPFEARDAARRRAEARYRSIFENAVEAIYQSMPGGQFLDVNPAMAKLLGYDSPQELIRSVRNIGSQIYADPQARAEFTATLERDGRFENREAQVLRRDASLMWISENARAVRSDTGELLHYEGTFVD
ncbi:MAG TPA: PAS domain-containing protein, partial [Gammaproteobacteria bacterium]|nr:PAS domain-containing protein [Gammaproteobacteria bacterium]